MIIYKLKDFIRIIKENNDDKKESIHMVSTKSGVHHYSLRRMIDGKNFGVDTLERLVESYDGEVILRFKQDPKKGPMPPSE